jgi:hypothetical protein
MCCAGPLMEMSVRNWINVMEASDIVYGNVAPPMTVTCMVTLNDFDMGSRPIGLVVFVLELYGTDKNFDPRVGQRSPAPEMPI